MIYFRFLSRSSFFVVVPWHRLLVPKTRNVLHFRMKTLPGWLLLLRYAPVLCFVHVVLRLLVRWCAGAVAVLFAGHGGLCVVFRSGPFVAGQLGVLLAVAGVVVWFVRHPVFVLLVRLVGPMEDNL